MKELKNVPDSFIDQRSVKSLIKSSDDRIMAYQSAKFQLLLTHLTWAQTWPTAEPKPSKQKLHIPIGASVISVFLGKQFGACMVSYLEIPYKKDIGCP